MTIAQLREKELERFNDAFIHSLDDARHIITTFYRCAGLCDRLLYLDNDERTCNRRSTQELHERADRQVMRLNALLKPYGLVTRFSSWLPSICKLEDKYHCEVFNRYFYN